MSRILIAIVLALMTATAIAGSDPILKRQHSMEDARDAAKTVGGMLKGEQPFDAAAAMQAFEAWKNTAAEVGALFPEGSESGHDTEAKATIWSDRAGFDKALQNFAAKVDAAIAAAPDSLETLKTAAGPVFSACKDCHEGYRVEKDN